MRSNKYGLMMIWVFVVGFLTWVLNAIQIEYFIENDPVFEKPDNILSQAFMIVDTWWRLITFRIDAIPPFVQGILAFTIYAPLLTFIGMLVVNWIRGTE